MPKPKAPYTPTPALNITSIAKTGTDPVTKADAESVVDIHLNEKAESDTKAFTVYIFSYILFNIILDVSSWKELS
jgi:hypothetical protein